MDLSAIFQMKTKRFWWVDVIFYAAVSLLVAMVFCWLIFLVKNSMQRNDIQQETEKLQTVGTSDQRDYEKSVLYYQKKVNQFAGLLASHQFASNVFSFLQEQTMPNVWFSQFGLDQKNNAVQLTGESETMDAFSRQVATFEKNKYVKSIGTLNTALVNSARVGFNIKLTLDQNIFSYISGDSSILETTTP